ncbi:MAG: hypothetical protein AB1714_13050 [Acidobacteriota bacterium]
MVWRRAIVDGEGETAEWSYEYPGFNLAGDDTVVVTGPATQKAYAKYGLPGDVTLDPVITEKWYGDTSYHEWYGWQRYVIGDINHLNECAPIWVPLRRSVKRTTLPAQTTIDAYYYDRTGPYERGLPTSITHSSGTGPHAASYTDTYSYAFESDQRFKDSYMLSYVSNQTTTGSSGKLKETKSTYDFPTGAVTQVERWVGSGNWLTWGYENQLANPALITITTDLPGSAGKQIAKYDHGVQSLLKWQDGFTVFSRTISPHDSSILTETNQHGGTMGFSYDNLGRVTDVTMPGQFANITVRWAENGRSATVTQEQKQIVKYWDGLGRALGHTEKDLKTGTTLQYRKELDKEGRVVAESRGSTDPLDVYSYIYNQAGDVVQTTDPRNKTTIVSLENGLKDVTDANGKHWKYRYDGLPGRITLTTEPNGVSTAYYYDDIGRLLRADLSGGRTQRYSHDGMDNVTSESHPETGTISYTYSPTTGNLERKVWATTAINYGYNTFNQLKTLNSGDDDLNYGYDPGDGTLRSVESATKGWKRTGISYNPLGSVEHETLTIPGMSAKTLAYEHDASNNLSAVVYPDGQRITYTNTGFDAPDSVRRNGARIVDSALYADYKQPTSIGFANGTTFTAAYLKTGHLGSARLANSTKNLYRAVYGYDGNYNITSITDTNPQLDATFEYDDLNRLTKVEYTPNSAGRVPSIAYQYDGLGNARQITEGTSSPLVQTFNGKNQIIGLPYDGRGNLKSDGVYQYVWDNQNRLAEVRKMNAEAGSDMSSLLAEMDGDTTPDAGTAELPLLASYLYDDRGMRLKTDRSPQGTVVTGEIVVEYPNGGEALIVGKSTTIKWRATSNIATVRIELLISVGNATQIKVIKSSFDAAARQCKWTADTAAGRCYIRISNTAGPEEDTSDAPFSIVQKKLTVREPNGGEHWEALTEHNIVWIADGDFGTQTMAIKYSTDNGTNWKAVDGANALDPKSKSFKWSVPNAPSEQCLIRIHTGNEDTQDLSDGTFTIEPSNRAIKVLYPNGGRVPPHNTELERQTFQAGTEVMISWELTGHFASGKGLRISLVDDSSSPERVRPIAEKGYVTSCRWIVDDAPGNAYRIRVEEITAGVKDESDEHFRIVAAPATLRVTRPEGGELLGVGNKYRIEWVATSVSLCQHVRIDLIKNLPDHDLETIEVVPSCENSGHYLCEVPPVPEGLSGDGWRVRIQDPGDADPSAMSKPFSIVPQQMVIKVEWPNGKNDGLTIGTKQTIKWNPGDMTRIQNVKVSLSRTGKAPYSESLHPGRESVPNSGELPWPVTGPASTECLIEIKDAGGVTADTSDAKFPINDGFTIKKPVGGDVLRNGKSYTIKWSPSGTPKNVKIQIKRDGGDWKHIDPKNTTYTNEGSLSWIVTEPEAAECYLRVSDAANMKFCGETKEPFSIRPSITVTSPNGGEQLKVGTTATIAWTTGGNVRNVNVDISRNNGQSWSRIKAGIVNTGSCQWPVVTPTSTNCLTRVSDLDKDPWDESDATFSIVRVVTGARGENEMSHNCEDVHGGSRQPTTASTPPCPVCGTRCVRDHAPARWIGAGILRTPTVDTARGRSGAWKAGSPSCSGSRGGARV